MEEERGSRKKNQGKKVGEGSGKEKGADEKHRLSGLGTLSHGKWNQNLVRKRPSQPTTTKER